MLFHKRPEGRFVLQYIYMKKWIFYTSLLLFFLPTATSAQYLKVDDFESYNNTIANGYGGDYILTPEHELGFWYIDGDNPTQDIDPYWWTQILGAYDSYNGLKSFGINRVISSFYFNGNSTTTITGGGIQTISYKVYVPTPYFETLSEGTNLTTWQRLWVGKPDFNNLGNPPVRYNQNFFYHDIFVHDDNTWGIALYDNLPFLNAPDMERVTVGGKFDQWNEVFIEINYDTGIIRYYVNDSEWLEWGNSVVDPNLNNPYSHVSGITFLPNQYVAEAGTTKNEFQDDNLKMHAIDDIELNTTPSYREQPTCEVHYDVASTTSWQPATNYSNDRPYTSGFVFTPSESCQVGSVLARIRYNGNYDDFVAVRVYEMDSIDSDLELEDLVGRTSFSYFNIDKTGSTTSQFDFLNTLQLLEDKHYLFNFVGSDHSTTTWGGGDGYDLAVYDDINFNGDVYRGYNTTGSLINSFDLNTQFYFTAYTDNINSLIVDEPCNLVSKSTEDTQGLYGSCIYAVEDIEYAPPITISGVSTGKTSDFLDGEYVLEESLLDTNMQLVYSRETDISVGVNYNFNNQLDMNALLYNEVSDSKLYTYRICQKSKRAQDLVDEGLVVLEIVGATSDKICVDINIGWNMTAEQAGDLLENLKRERTDGGKIDKDKWWLDNCTYETWNDYLNVFKSGKCAIFWAFAPDEESIDTLLEVRDNILYTVPIGYATHTYNDLKEALVSTSTEAFDKEIEVARIFGETGGTTTIEVSNLLKYRYMWQPIEDFFDTVMYILLVLGLLYWGLKQRL